MCAYVDGVSGVCACVCTCEWHVKLKVDYYADASDMRVTHMIYMAQMAVMFKKILFMVNYLMYHKYPIMVYTNSLSTTYISPIIYFII